MRDSVVALAQWPGGGAVAVGARGLVARSAGAGWQIVAQPGAGDSLVAVAAREDSSLVVLSGRGIFTVRKNGARQRLAELPPLLQSAYLVAALPRGRAALATRDRIAFVDSSGRITSRDLIRLKASSRPTSLLALPDGRVVMTMSEPADNPYAMGWLLAIRQDSVSGNILQDVPYIERAWNDAQGVRSGLYATHLHGRAGAVRLVAAGMGRLWLEWRRDSVAQLFRQ